MTHRIEIITDKPRFIEVGAAWDDLWSRSQATIFQTHHWLEGWVAGVAERGDVQFRFAVMWDGMRMLGVIPCVVQRRSALRVLTWAAQVFSDYCDCLVDRGVDSRSVLAPLWDGLRQRGGFDLISLQQVRPDAACRPLFDDLVQHKRGLSGGERAERCMRIDKQWPDGEAFFRSLNKKARNNHTRGQRILSEMGGALTFEVIDAGSPAGSIVTDILDLKRKWLRVVDPASPLLGQDGVVLRSVLDAVWKGGLAKIFLLRCSGRLVAASINFVYAGRMEAYLTAYDSAFERASPGTILIVDYARWAFDRGLASVDFLRGEEPFKFRMANAETVLSSYAGGKTLMGHVAISSHRWLAWWRQRQNSAAATELEAAE